MGVMVQFSNPTYGGVKEADPNPVTLGPYDEVRVEDAGAYGDGEDYSIAIGYYDDDEKVWIHDDRTFVEMKIFAASSVVPT